MKKKIAILGSTGSIGKTLLNIIEKDRQNFEIVLLAANKNHKLLLKQAKKYKVKNLIISNLKSYKHIIKNKKKLKIKVFNNFNYFNKIFKKKIDYSMSAITGIDGLIPTLKIIKYTKNIAIANKESIICGWSLIKKELKLNNTFFVPVDSEHFSIWYGLKNNIDQIDRIYLTASGGPFIDMPKNKFKKISVKQALNHPNWKMGKKISIDSATMMNKVFEIIEAKKIFNVNYNQLSILTHPKSYVHAIIKFNNGLIKFIAHDTDMRIPIFNSLYSASDLKNMKSSKINLNNLNNLNLNDVEIKKFPLIKILSQIPKKNSLFETILVTANDELVNLFLRGQINFLDISKRLLSIVNSQEFEKYKFLSPKNVDQILKLNKYVSLKINPKSI
tara:strand:+ start:899 stop:2062 length:1164 start_codon:yes stop_codon:yes gene_type:complete